MPKYEGSLAKGECPHCGAALPEILDVERMPNRTYTCQKCGAEMSIISRHIKSGKFTVGDLKRHLENLADEAAVVGLLLPSKGKGHEGVGGFAVDAIAHERIPEKGWPGAIILVMREVPDLKRGFGGFDPNQEDDEDEDEDEHHEGW